MMLNVSVRRKVQLKFAIGPYIDVLECDGILMITSNFVLGGHGNMISGGA